MSAVMVKLRREAGEVSTKPSFRMKRLWVRRAYRAGWLVNAVVSIPMRLYREATYSTANFCLAIVILAFATFFFVGATRAFMNDRVSTPEAILEAAKDPCVKEALPSFAARTHNEVTGRTIEMTQQACETARNLEQQLKVLK